jgi:hypothetical protein
MYACMILIVCFEYKLWHAIDVVLCTSAATNCGKKTTFERIAQVHCCCFQLLMHECMIFIVLYIVKIVACHHCCFCSNLLQIVGRSYKLLKDFLGLIVVFPA